MSPVLSVLSFVIITKVDISKVIITIVVESEQNKLVRSFGHPKQ
jgi:hypothetical protein